MTAELNHTELQILTAIAEHRMLTVSQLALLHDRSLRSTRRVLVRLQDAGQVEASPGGFGRGRGRGRPEKILSLTDAGVTTLRAADLLDRETPNEQVKAGSARRAEHQLLLNWFRIQLQAMERQAPQFKVRFLSPIAVEDFRDQPTATGTAHLDRINGCVAGLMPDGTFSITHLGRQRTLLFFLEVDMGTEPVASKRVTTPDIRHKLLAYQSHFRTGQYKRYEQPLGASLRGFRVLFLTNASSRLASLCRLVLETPPSDFIWLTDQDRMFSQDVGTRIWARGGRADAPPESILGTEMPSSLDDQPAKR